MLFRSGVINGIIGFINGLIKGVASGINKIIDVINKLKGDRYCTHTLSNLGKIDLPESLRPYVRDIDFVLGRQRGNSGASACVGINGNLILNMSRRIAEHAFEDAFIEQLAMLGIPVEATEESI